MNPVEVPPPSFSPGQVDNATPFPIFLETFKAQLKDIFQAREGINQFGTSRGVPPEVLRELMTSRPLSTFVPSAYGGRGGDPEECIALVEAASYESLALALTFGINWALFIQPVAKYGQETARQATFKDFVSNGRMGGLMITEPGYGTDALHMQSAWSEQDGQCHIRGTKHWAGLTGLADYWLLTARQANRDGGLGRDIDFFICDANAPGQKIVVEELFNNLGLYMIPYGRNRIDILVPAGQRLVPHSSGIKMMLDLLHRSRLNFPAMAMGYLERVLDEAASHCRQRLVGGRSLLGYDQVQSRLAKIQSAVTICASMCVNTYERAGLDNNLAGSSLEANAIKACITDLMQEAAQSLLQLVGAKGYRIDHFAGRTLVDSRPFQIFEGSNDILYIQITEALLKQMKAAREPNLYCYLNGFALTRRASERLKSLLDFELNRSLPQRKLVEFGQLVSRLIAMDLVIKSGERGFDRQLIENCLTNLHQEIASLLTRSTFDNRTALIDPEQKHPSWRGFCNRQSN